MWCSMIECRTKYPTLIHECRTYNIFYWTMFNVWWLFWSLRDTGLHRFRVSRVDVEECLTIYFFFFFFFFFFFIFFFFFLYNLLFFMYTSVSRNVMLVFDILYSNVMDSCFVLSSFKNFIRSFLLAVH